MWVSPDHFSPTADRGTYEAVNDLQCGLMEQHPVRSALNTVGDSLLLVWKGRQISVTVLLVSGVQLDQCEFQKRPRFGWYDSIRILNLDCRQQVIADSNVLHLQLIRNLNTPSNSAIHRTTSLRRLDRGMYVLKVVPNQSNLQGLVV